ARHKAPYKLSGTVTIRALIDAASAEVFIDGGKLAMTDIFFPQEDFTDLILYTEHGTVVLESGVVYGMESIW
ncbi:MAG TPA: GH32 C-terminal domain-containing protein, partial [Chitinophagales bacterium]|nr:GH32 C-terminal domain-containing protein [Chitinophagales bacterium]